jgi:hypothetical protein
MSTSGILLCGIAYNIYGIQGALHAVFRFVSVKIWSLKFRTHEYLADNRNLTFLQLVAENSSLMGCDAMSLGTCFPTFRKKTLPSPSKPPWSVTLEDESDRSLRNVFTFHIPQSLNDLIPSVDNESQFWVLSRMVDYDFYHVPVG